MPDPASPDTPSKMMAGLFSKRSKTTPIALPVSPGSAANSKEIEAAVQTAVQEASAAAVKVEETMYAAWLAAQDMEAGTARRQAELAVTRAAGELRSTYNQYERLQEDVVNVIAAEQGPNCFVRAGGCVLATVRKTWEVIIGTLRAMQVPALFYFVGCLVYNYLEGWSYLETVYFLTVTSTTVGYGDLFPTSSMGKLFTCIYALIGITVVLGSLAPLVAFLRGDWREKLLTALGCGARVALEDPQLTMEQINNLINYKRRYALALLGPGFVLVCGMCLHYLFIREPLDTPPEGFFQVGSFVIGGFDYIGFIDSFYWAVITMTTIGYGDITPATQTAKLLAIFYLPLAVIALADAVSDVQMIGLRRSIRETDFSKLADECLLRDALRDDGPPNLDPVLNEAEFLVDQLIANELVDEEAVKVINRQFANLTRKGNFGPDEPHTLTAKLVFEEMKDRVAAGKTLSDGATQHDLNPDGNFKWTTFDEWAKKSWGVRVLDKYSEKTGNSLKKSSLGKKGQMRTIVGAGRGGKKR